MHDTSSRSSKGVARLFVRIGFGLSLAFVGFTHYQDATYAESVGRGLGVLEPLGMVWGYILPGLMIVGGLLLAFGIYHRIAAYLTSIALISIPAGLMLKSAISGIPLDDTMPPAMNAFIWILVLMVALKPRCGSSAACCCGPMCACPCPPMDMPAAAPAKPAPAPMKSAAPAAPAATAKPSSTAKKSTAKKSSSKKSTAKKSSSSTKSAA